MSHSVSVRTHTVTSSSTAIIINTGYLKTWGGLFKFLELALGIVCVGIMGDHFTPRYHTTTDIFYLIITSAFMIATFILLLSCLASLSTSSIISKTLYELLYHSIAFGLILSASIALLVQVTDNGRSREYELMLAASVCGLVNAVFYFLSTIIALRSYRGL